jgi:voltage-gated potassium channel
MKLKENDYAGVNSPHSRNPLKHKIFVIIFGTDTRAGRLFDIVLLWLILFSVIAIMLESVNFINDRYGLLLRSIEWIVTIAFTIEYIARIVVVQKPRAYIFSFFGIIDLLSIIPAYLSLIVVGSQSLAVLRAIRLLRVFRILKLAQFVNESRVLANAIKESRHKIMVFFMSVLILVFVMGSVMYLVEGGENGFHSIPISIYWAIVTLTTVGFGDITPQTIGGQFIASIIMLLGYSIIAIPTGIVGAEIYREVDRAKSAKARSCAVCLTAEDRPDAEYCRKCGEKFPDSANEN